MSSAASDLVDALVKAYAPYVRARVAWLDLDIPPRFEAAIEDGRRWLETAPRPARPTLRQPGSGPTRAVPGSPEVPDSRPGAGRPKARDPRRVGDRGVTRRPVRPGARFVERPRGAGLESTPGIGRRQGGGFDGTRMTTRKGVFGRRLPRLRRHLDHPDVAGSRSAHLCCGAP